MNTEAGTEVLEPVNAANQAPSPASQLDARGPLGPSRDTLFPTSAAAVFFDIVISTLWSDGPLEPREVQRGRIIANALGVVPPRGGVFGAIADGPLPFPSLAFDVLTAVECRQAYALVLWLVAEQPMGSRRSSFMHALRRRLALSETDAMELAQRAADPAFCDLAEMSVLDLLDTVATDARGDAPQLRASDA